MALAYRIANWTRYMPADARKCTVMQWVAVPIAHDGMGYIEIMTHPDGIRIVGGWLLILQTAARCPERGLLVSDGGRILRAREIALKTRAREEDIKLALEECCRQSWIEEVEVSGQYPDDVRTPSRLQDRTVQDITVQDKKTEPDGSEADSVGPLFITQQGAWRLTAGYRQSLAALFPTAPIDVELAKAAAWCEKATKKKSARGMHAFLTNWLARHYAKPPALPAEQPTQEALAALIEEEAKLRAEGKIP